MARAPPEHKPAANDAQPPVSGVRPGIREFPLGSRTSNRFCTLIKSLIAIQIKHLCKFQLTLSPQQAYQSGSDKHLLLGGAVEICDRRMPWRRSSARVSDGLREVRVVLPLRRLKTGEK